MLKEYTTKKIIELAEESNNDKDWMRRVWITKKENQKLKESLDKLEKDIKRLEKLNIENYNDFVKIQIENQKLKETIEKVETIIWLKKNDGDWMDYSYGYIYNEIKKLVKQEKKQ